MDGLTQLFREPVEPVRPQVHGGARHDVRASLLKGPQKMERSNQTAKFVRQRKDIQKSSLPPRKVFAAPRNGQKDASPPPSPPLNTRSTQSGGRGGGAASCVRRLSEWNGLILACAFFFCSAKSASSSQFVFARSKQQTNSSAPDVLHCPDLPPRDTSLSSALLALREMRRRHARHLVLLCIVAAAVEGARGDNNAPQDLTLDSPWATLGLRVGASDADVRAAFKTKALEHHPDKGGSEEAFIVVRRAFEELTKRRDDWMRGGSTDGFGGDGGGAGGGFNQHRRSEWEDIRMQVVLEMKNGGGRLIMPMEEYFRGGAVQAQSS
jgi:hypothetical protein